MSDNRIMEGMQEWLEREKNIAGLFSPATLHTRYFQQLKLDYLRELHNNTKSNATKDERMTRRILKGEIEELERKLYPNLLVRLAVAIVRVVKEILQNTKKVTAFEGTQWMMKVEQKDSRILKPSKNDGAKVYQHKKVQPGLVEKKRQSNSKGLGM